MNESQGGGKHGLADGRVPGVFKLLSARVATVIVIATIPTTAIASPRVMAPQPRTIGRAGAAPTAPARSQRRSELEQPSCSVSWGNSNPTFGTISSSGTTGALVNTALTVSCTGEVAATAQLCDSHTGPGGAFTLRSGESTIPFTIDYYNGASSATRLSDCANPGIPLNGGNASTTFRLVAVIPAGESFEPGAYADAVVATVVY